MDAPTAQTNPSNKDNPSEKSHFKLGSDSLLFAIVRVLTSVMSFAVSSIITHSFSLAEAGSYSQVILVESLATTICQFSLTDALNYFYNSDGERDKSRILSSTLFIQVILGLITTAVICLLAQPLTLYYDNPSVLIPLFIVSSYPIVVCLLNLTYMVLLSSDKAKLVSIMSLVCVVLNLAGTAIGSILFHNLLITVLSLVVSSLIPLIFLWIYIHKRIVKISFKEIDKKVIKDTISFAAPLFAYSIVSTINRYSDKIIVSQFVSTETQGIFNFSARVLPFNLVTAAFVTIMAPVVTKLYSAGENDRIVRIYRNYLYIGFMTTAVLCIGVVLCSGEMMTVLYGEEYVIGKHVFAIYALSEIPVLFNLSLVLRCAHKTKSILLLGIISVVVNIGLDYLLYFALGIVGPAVATLISHTLLYMGFFVISKRILNCRFSDFFEIKDTILLLIEGAVLFGGIFALKTFFLDAHIKNQILLIASTYIPFCFLVWLLNAPKIVKVLKDMNKI